MTTTEERATVGASATAPQQVGTVHIIFKTHLDIGFTDFARNVVEQYHHTFIPNALRTAQALRERGGSERMIWTTGSWLIYEYLQHATPAERERFEAAIRAGDIVWHGLPFTTHTELLDPSLFAYGLTLSKELDRRFGKTTIAGKMTDVPGHTRGIVPLLANAGIEFLHIGVNPTSETPDVPPAFVWRDPSGADVVMMYQRGSYGDLIMVPGLADVLYFAHTDDNLGPHTPEQVLDIYAQLQARFPEARVIASTLDAFAERLLTVKAQLPVVQQELGDTWIHGVGSDPLRISHFRELQRLRSAWLAAGSVRADDPALAAFTHHLIMVPEHTWGLDEKRHLPADSPYDTATFQTLRGTDNYRDMEDSWNEQRAYLDDALAALDGTPQGEQARAALAALAPAAPDLANFTRVAQPATPVETANFTIAFDPHSGAIAHLVDKATGRTWADEQHPLALFGYQLFGSDDYDRFMGQYLINLERTRHWALHDFGKFGIQNYAPHGHTWQPTLQALHHHASANGHRFVAELALPAAATERGGAPRQIVLEAWLTNNAPEIQVTLQWFGKTATRLPEALWLSFVPVTEDQYGWRFDKLGEAIEPHDVIANGNRKLHAVGQGVRYEDTAGTWALGTLDAPLVAPGQPSLLDFNNQQPDMEHGVHVNLFNNVWGTNFRMWYDDDTRFRFTIACG